MLLAIVAMTEAETPMPRRYQTLSDLPGELAVFPLTGAILLPRASLPPAATSCCILTPPCRRRDMSADMPWSSPHAFRRLASARLRAAKRVVCPLTWGGPFERRKE